NFTFSAKERDVETGLSYFGSRYYSSDLSIWLSVDPQAAKYPSLSPYVYCANNPVKLVDPNGEEIVITSTTDDNGNTSVHIKFTGMLVNKSSQNYTKEDLIKLKNTISNSIKEKYSGNFGEGVTVTTSVDIITEGEKKLENYFVDRDRHQINMVDALSDKNNIAEAEIGGGFMNICTNIGKGDNCNDIDRTAAHEFGHLLGLQHSKISGNLMERGELGTSLTSGQIKDAVSNYNNDMLNTGIPSRDNHRRVINYAKERIRNALGFH
ncbi:MAG: matrixin family metalloprotease, partial [Bacteroidales bacterium]|nr:matrixin family metalloprotease [Bacteroidales bacterium]